MPARAGSTSSTSATVPIHNGMARRRAATSMPSRRDRRCGRFPARSAVASSARALREAAFRRSAEPVSMSSARPIASAAARSAASRLFQSGESRRPPAAASRAASRWSRAARMARASAVALPSAPARRRRRLAARRARSRCHQPSSRRERSRSRCASSKSASRSPGKSSRRNSGRSCTRPRRVSRSSQVAISVSMRAAYSTASAAASWWRSTSRRLCPLPVPEPSRVRNRSRRSESPKWTGSGPGWRSRSSARTSAAWTDWAAMSTDCPSAMASRAIAASVWLLPQPGAPAMTVTGAVRAWTTASVCSPLSGSGQCGGRVSVSASGAVSAGSYIAASAVRSIPGRFAQSRRPVASDAGSISGAM